MMFLRTRLTLISPKTGKVAVVEYLGPHKCAEAKKEALRQGLQALGAGWRKATKRKSDAVAVSWATAMDEVILIDLEPPIDDDWGEEESEAEIDTFPGLDEEPWV